MQTEGGIQLLVLQSTTVGTEHSMEIEWHERGPLLLTYILQYIPYTAAVARVSFFVLI